MIIDASIRRMMKPGQPEWLTRLQNDLALITAAEAQKQRAVQGYPGGPNFNPRLEQTQQVERDALRLAETIPANLDVLNAAVWIYSRCLPRPVAGSSDEASSSYEEASSGEDETKAAAASAQCAADWARQNLAGYGFPADQVETVAQAVAGAAAEPGQLPEQQIEARLLWDAVKLASIGSLNIVTYLTSHPAFPEQRLSYTGLALHGLEQLERSRRLAECLYFEVSRQLAHRRYEQQKMFYEALASDVEV